MAESRRKQTRRFRKNDRARSKATGRLLEVQEVAEGGGTVLGFWTDSDDKTAGLETVAAADLELVEAAPGTEDDTGTYPEPADPG